MNQPSDKLESWTGPRPGETASEAALALAAAKLKLTLEPRQSSQLLGHLTMLQRWNAVYNLTAVRDPSAMLTQHLVDCLAVVPALRRHVEGNRINLLDVGSGGGLPGVVLAVMEPQWSVTCVDAVSKKAVFVRQVAGELGLNNLKSVHGRVEEMVQETGFDVIASRAFAALAAFVGTTRHLLSPGGVWLAMKGRPPEEEVRELPTYAGVFHVELIRVPELNAQRCLVWMRPH